MVCECIENEIKNLKKIKNIKNLIRIDFDNFAEKTNYNLSKICKFLKTNQTKHTSKIMRRERLPRKIIENDRIKKRQKIKELVSDKLFQRLLRLEKFYIKEKKLNKW